MPSGQTVITRQVNTDSRSWYVLDSDDSPDAWIATTDPAEVRQ